MIKEHEQEDISSIRSFSKTYAIIEIYIYIYIYLYIFSEYLVILIKKP